MRPSTNKVALYLCDGCKKLIGCTPSDPAVITRLGKMHHRCMKQAWAQEAKKKQEHREEVFQRRSAAQKRWRQEKAE
jgi:hypothetical protein